MKEFNKKRVIIPFFMTISAAGGAAVYQLYEKKKKRAIKTGRHVPYGLYEAVLKRPLDMILAGALLTVLAPLMGVIALLVRIKMGSPVFFCQRRPGLDEKIFTLCKFRTMNGRRRDDEELLPDAKRLTPFGRALRTTSLDELPELYNILIGDMSFVGPRPLLEEYLEPYDNRQKRRHEVRPGLTGLAQVSGRNTISWSEKFEADVKYVDKITFLGDMKIILRTVAVVIAGTGISSQTSATMEEFTGNGYKGQ